MKEKKARRAKKEKGNQPKRGCLPSSVTSVTLTLSSGSLALALSLALLALSSFPFVEGDKGFLLLLSCHHKKTKEKSKGQRPDKTCPLFTIAGAREREREAKKKKTSCSLLACLPLRLLSVECVQVGLVDCRGGRSGGIRQIVD